mmetsp:Transcript_95739/g.255875  ORF Transcript_95739/g.255875 Transcript_95739/m.255875 type:complete len:218 (-) Transcript_95739:1574-2227(-)
MSPNSNKVLKSLCWKYLTWFSASRMVFSMPVLWICSLNILSSIVPQFNKRYTCTGCSWPIRHTLAMAWASTAGFHAGSTRITRSAAVRVKPTPPTCTVRSMQKYREPGFWNLFTFWARSSGSVPPSTRRNFSSRGRRTVYWMRSSMRVLWEKIRHRRPFSCRAGSRTSSVCSLADWSRCCSAGAWRRWSSRVSTACDPTVATGSARPAGSCGPLVGP